MKFDVVAPDSALNDTFAVVLETDAGREARIHFNAVRFFRYMDRASVQADIEDHVFAARSRTQLRLGRVEKVPEKGEDQTPDEEFQAVLSEELQRDVGEYTAEALRKRGDELNEALPAELAKCADSWENIFAGGEEIVFSREHAEALFRQGGLGEAISRAAVKAFMAFAAARKELEGNSEASSTGE